MREPAPDLDGIARNPASAGFFVVVPTIAGQE
jgi:hypothetical protein